MSSCVEIVFHYIRFQVIYHKSLNLTFEERKIIVVLPKMIISIIVVYKCARFLKLNLEMKLEDVYSADDEKNQLIQSN